jgi:hypothetical protein
MMRTFLLTSATLTAAAVCAALVLDSPASAAAPTTHGVGTSAGSDRGRLVSVEHLRALSAKQTGEELAKAGFDRRLVRYGVDTYRLVYRTVDAQSRPTTASGLLVLPRNGARQLPAVSFDHGTQSYKGDAPSMGQDDFGPAPALTYGSVGFATAAPDYLGLGLGPGFHPWMDVPSETTASLDMLRAARAFVPRTGRELEPQVLVTGFSQGASAAMGLGRALQSGADPWFRLGALAPISGAYDFQNAEVPALLNGEVEAKSATLYPAYLLVAYNRLHHLYDSPSQVFQAPYDRTIEQLFDGSHTGQQLFAGTPGTIDELLTPYGKEMLRHPTGPLAAALQVLEGTCSDWTPQAPIRLYLSNGDEQAVNANSRHCQAALRSHGVDAPLIELGPLDYQGSRHLGSNVSGTTAVARWFDRLSSAVGRSGR